MENRLIGVAELADFLGVKKSWVYDRVRLGKIPSYRVGKYRRFSLAEVRDWLDKECRGEADGE